MEVTTLKPAEQCRRDLAIASGGLLQESWLHGYLWILELVTDSGVTVDVYPGRKRQYRVTWNAAVGEWQSGYKSRSRSFSKIESLLDFLKEF